MRKIILCLVLLLYPSLALAGDSPRVLAVIAHPDDEGGFAATLYAVAHHLHGTVDLVLVTDGSGGFKYSTLAEPIYGLKLTDETVAREYLPSIRRQELKKKKKIIGINQFFFLDQHDEKYTTDVDEIRKGSTWNIDTTRSQLEDILKRGNYDFIIGLAPRPDTHAHHSTATMLALEAREVLLPEKRPVALATTIWAPEYQVKAQQLGLKDYPITAVSGDKPIAEFDRTTPFGYDKKLNYKIIADWVIAAHKSQGTMQLFAGKGEREQFWYFKENPLGGKQKTLKLFASIREHLYK